MKIRFWPYNLILALLIVVPFNIYAALATSSRPLGSREEKLQEKSLEKREEAEKRIDEKKAKNIRKYFSKMGRRLESAIMRLDTLAGRVESRIEKLEKKGRDLGEARKKLDEARANISEAGTFYKEAKDKFVAIFDSDSPKTIFEEVRKTVGDVVLRIKKAHAALIESVSMIKNADLAGSESATTTSQ